MTFPTHDPGPLSNVESALVSTFRTFPADAPVAVMTVTSTVPEPGGATAVIELSLVTVNDRASDAPNRTDVALLNPPPVMRHDRPAVAGSVGSDRPTSQPGLIAGRRTGAARQRGVVDIERCLARRGRRRRGQPMPYRPG